MDMERKRFAHQAQGLITAFTLALLIAGCGGGGSNEPIGETTIQTLSNRADLISGGQALVQINIPASRAASSLRVDLDGADITPTFTVMGNGRLLGVVRNLKNGANVITARPSDATFGSARLTITNAPIGGPVLLSTQTQPWICATPTATTGTGNTPSTNASGLSTNAIDAACNIATEFKLFYRTTSAGCSTALPDPSPPATAAVNACFKPYTVGQTYTDLATTTTSNGVSVPYIVRVERGTINRGIYDIVVLFDPAKPWTAIAPQTQWNGKVLHSYGASTGHTRLQFRTEQNWADDNALSRGFMVVNHSLTDSLYNSNRVLGAETTMMVKEHIIENYGQIQFYMSNGCSGGSINQNTVASIYPGLLDGIQPSCDYADSITTGLEVTDCVLLVNFYAGPAFTALQTGLTQTQINAKKAAINGHLDHLGCQSWNNQFGFSGRPGNYVRTLVSDTNTGAITPETVPRNNCLLPAALVYDPVTNPTGTRCGDADNSAAIWGTTTGLAPGSTRALATLDNVGIQYGLGALKSGTISTEEFVTLNEKIGGFNVDATPVAGRSVADAAALDIAYKSGIVSSGKNLAKVAIVDQRGYDEQGIHYIWRTYAERARLDAEAGSHANHVMFRFGTGLLPSAASGISLLSQQVMDVWLSNLTAQAPKAWVNAERTQAQVVAAKPATAFDFCYLSTDTTFTTKVTDMAACDKDARLVTHASPRQVAGGPLVENSLKCTLKPLSLTGGDYGAAVFSAAQQSRLQAAFPAGVCDWTKAGIGQQSPTSPQTYKAGPGGVPLPALPVSIPS